MHQAHLKQTKLEPKQVKSKSNSNGQLLDSLQDLKNPWRGLKGPTWDRGGRKTKSWWRCFRASRYAIQDIDGG